jgi:YYY domain-containing protein
LCRDERESLSHGAWAHSYFSMNRINVFLKHVVTTRSSSWLLLVVLAFSVTVRVYGINWDVGHSWSPHPDERAIMMKVGQLQVPPLAQIGTIFDSDKSTLNPGWFAYGSLPLYTLKLCQVVLSSLPGVEINDLRVVGRLLSALADVVTVWVVFKLGISVHSRRAGVLSAALVSMAVIHVQLSHFYTVDTLLVLLTVASLYFLIQVSKYGKLKDSLLAGTLIGLGLATKISLLPIFLPFVIAHFFYLISAIETGVSRDGGLSRLGSSVLKGSILGIIASFVAFIVVQPYVILDWAQFLSDFTEQSEMVRRIRDYPYTRQYVDTTPYLYHLRQLTMWGLGLPLGITVWFGLLYSSLRGLSLRQGLFYLNFGVLVPALILVLSSNILAIVLACIIAAIAVLLAGIFRTRESRQDALMISWVVPYFLVVGSLDVKFSRYLLPVTPFLIIFASKMIWALWDKAKTKLNLPKPTVVIALGLLLGSTGIYTLSYMSVYQSSHTAVRTASWLQDNAEKGAVILKEHWEEGIPGLVGFRIIELPMYEPDSSDKLKRIATLLSEADYIWFYSNRLYGTIPRLDEKYPYSTNYYRQLFNGKLGYELVNAEASYPKILTINFTDDTFARPGLEPPEGIGKFLPEGPNVSWGYADESFTVYDHPMGMVFQNVERYGAEETESILLGGVASRAPENALPDTGLMFSSGLREEQRLGGTWTEIFRVDSRANQFPVIFWLLFIQLFAIVVLPVMLMLFSPLPDSGYIFSKVVGLLVIPFGPWLLASLGWSSFSGVSIAISLVVVGVSSLIAFAIRRKQLAGLLKQKWRIFAIEETVFLVAFFAFVAIRMGNPDLWHPYLGGEKPMDFAYLNAVLRSTYMPPYDPWLAGGYLNYYYWGYVIVASLIKVTGIVPEVAYNLAVALFFSLTASGAFGLLYNLSEKSRSNMLVPRPWRTSVLAGLVGTTFVVVIGNLDGAAQVIEGLWRAVVQGLSFWHPRGEFDFWRSSRMMTPGNEITEFPFFTFLFADLHAHMIAIPFTLLVLGVALTILWSKSGWSISGVLRLGTIGFAVGALRVINTWDYPTYLMLSAGTIYLAEYFRHGGASLSVLLNSGVKTALVFAVGYIAFLPYHANYEIFFDGLDSTTGKTVMWQFLGINGLFVFIIATFFLKETRVWFARVFGNSVVQIGVGRFEGKRRSLFSRTPDSGDSQRVGLWLSPIVIVAILGVVLVSSLTDLFGSTAPSLFIFALIVVVAGIKFMQSSGRNSPQLAFVSLMVFMGTSLALGLEFFRVEGDVDRMNSVFKFYLQIWILFSVASAYLLWHMSQGWSHWIREKKIWTQAWVCILALLVIGSAAYPILSIQPRLNNRFSSFSPTLNGMQYMRVAKYDDRNGEIDLSSDLEGIEWLRGNVQGSPVILEGVTPMYRWGGRISIYTGLPSVIGWKWHQEQQRWGYRGEISSRLTDVRTIYSTENLQEALELILKYEVEYIYIGQLERIYYPLEGLEKFTINKSDQLQRVFSNPDVTIYKVRKDVF